jgi:hypothetical protein
MPLSLLDVFLDRCGPRSQTSSVVALNCLLPTAYRLLYDVGMQTEIVPVSEEALASPALKRLVEIRRLSEEEFVERYASGTLRRNRRLGFAARSQYLEERIAFEFGWAFQCLPRSRVTFGDAITESDSKQLTEAGWVLDRYLTRQPFPEDRFQVKYIKIEDHDRVIREGVGLILFETSAAFIPNGSVVYAIVAEYDAALKDFRPHLIPLH